MEFSDFLREEEELDFLSEAINEGLWDVAAGLTRGVGGVMGVGDELIARAMGQGRKGELKRSLGDIGGGLHRAVFGKPSAKAEQPPASAPAPVRTATPEEIKAVKDEFERLKVAYKQAEKMGNRDLMRRVRARMMRVDPAAYADLLKKSIDAKKERDRRRWAFLDGVPDPRRPGEFLGGLGVEH